MGRAAGEPGRAANEQDVHRGAAFPAAFGGVLEMQSVEGTDGVRAESQLSLFDVSEGLVLIRDAHDGGGALAAKLLLNPLVSLQTRHVQSFSGDNNDVQFAGAGCKTDQ